MVGVRGLEPPASTSRTWRATKLRYTPNYAIMCCNVNLGVPTAVHQLYSLHHDDNETLGQKK